MSSADENVSSAGENVSSAGENVSSAENVNRGREADSVPRTSDPAVLPVRDAYRLWAESYDRVENVITTLDQAAVARLSPPLAGKALLDAGCGTGRRLRSISAVSSAAGRRGTRRRAKDPGIAVGVDLVHAMLVAGRRSEETLINADLLALPFKAASFDIVWCRLVLGHVAELDGAYAELARVLRRGGHVVATDFHPTAARAGHARTFRDSRGRLHAVQHFIHAGQAHVSAARAAGLSLAERLDLTPGPAVRPFYERADALTRYGAQRDTPLLLAFSFREERADGGATLNAERVLDADVNQHGRRESNLPA